MREQLVSVLDQTGHTIVASLKVRVARSFLERSRGLLWRPALAEHESMLIAPCAWIHTVGMAYPIDVLFISRDAVVMQVSADVASMRMRRCAGAVAVLETASGWCQRHGVRAGCRLNGLAGSELG